MKSRSFTIVDVPDPKQLKAKFVYNFFVNDEKVNDAGDPRAKDKGKMKELIAANAMQKEFPRYNVIEFPAVDVHIGNYSAGAVDIDDLMSEEMITNAGFAACRDSDTHAVPRINEKLRALSKVMGLKFQDSDQSKKIASALNFSQEDVQAVISPTNDPSVLLVNAKSDKSGKRTVFDLASQAKIQYLINKRLAYAAINAADDASPLSKLNTVSAADIISKEHIAQNKNVKLSLGDVEPEILSATTPIETKDTPKILGVATYGYKLFRQRKLADGSTGDSREFLLVGAKNTNHIDTEILYGTTYIYEVRAIFKIDAIVEGGIQDFQLDELKPASNWRVTLLVASRPSVSAFVDTEEFEAPNEPDGVTYRFNYDAGRGLLISWQIPAGRSRDTKYFQVFRRKTIEKPFTCIAMLDFDDSVIRTLLPEQVRQDRIFISSNAKTFYQDTTFDRQDSYIYAIAAIDAHGMSSGYSAQTRVGFDTVKNVLTLSAVSPGGAPKQYPNFYTDPRQDENISVDTFIQDAVFDSGHRTMKVYFTPDMKLMKISNSDNVPVFVIGNEKSGQSGTGYSFHTINLDLQKSSTAHISIIESKK